MRGHGLHLGADFSAQEVPIPVAWKEATPVSQRTELASLARGQAISVTELARRFGVSRKTAYKWMELEAAGEPLEDRSRRPERSPLKTALSIEEAVVTLRREHPCWGGRKLAKVLSIKAMPRAAPSRSPTSCAGMACSRAAAR